MGDIRRRLAAATAAMLVVIATAGPVLGASHAVDDAYSLAEDQQLVVEAPGVLGNDTFDAGTVCIVSVDTTGLAGSLGDGEVAADGSFTFTPNPDFNGETTFTYGLADKVADVCPTTAESTATVTITVTNIAPKAASDSFSALADRTLNVPAPGILANDSDADGDPLTAVKVSNPTHGVVILAPDGAFSYTPNPGFVGKDAFSYRASDGTDTSATRIVSLTVSAVPTPSPTHVPTPSPTLEPTPSPEITAEPSPTASEEPSAALSETPSASARPAATAPPNPAEGSAGLSLPVLVAGLLLLSLLTFGGALLIPKLLARQGRGAGGADSDDPFDGNEPFDDAGDDVPDDR